MEYVSQTVYQQNFNKIFAWLKNIHTQQWKYACIDLLKCPWKMVELYDEKTKKVFFRVLLKATYADVHEMKDYPKDFREINALVETKTDRILPDGFVVARQVCIVQLDDNDEPIKDALFTYASDGNYHKID